MRFPTTHFLRSPWLAATVFTAFAAFACERQPTASLGEEATRLVVAPQQARVAPGDSVEFSAVAYTRQDERAEVTVTWQSTGGSVQAAGQSEKVHWGKYKSGFPCGYNGITTDTVIAVARPGKAADTAYVAIDCPDAGVAVATVSVTPASATVNVGGTQQFTATLKDSSGNTLTGRSVSWASGNTGVATVNASSGLVSGAGAGSTTITATSEGQSGTAAITVQSGSGGGSGGSTVANFKVAFIGDQGDGSDALAVLRLIRDEGADMVLHQGDFDYGDNPTAWDNTITSVLGAGFPYFASVGNHDDAAWGGSGGYQDKLKQRLARVAGASCSGDYGVNSACTYQGLFFILSGAGTLGSGHESYIRQQLASNTSTWSICTWHKNQNAMQVGGKSNEVGWGPYEACRELGAIIATAHEHSYSRTKTLVSTQSQTVDPAWTSPTSVRVTPGATFVFVSGLGGASIRDQQRCLPTSYPYGCNGEWASIYSSSQGARYGALFIEFNVDGDPNKARGYFKDVGGRVVDQFTVTSQP